MRSALSWLDHSEDDRRRMREIIDLFGEQETRDELGLGGIRDAFADLLFPGTSTIQTRPRYFLLVPWVYRRLEREKVPSSQARAKARSLEIKLVHALLDGGESDGVLGGRARDHLIRLPSSVYWGGLGRFRIRLFRGSIDDYHRSLDGYHRRAKQVPQREGDEVHERATGNWHPALPDPPDDLFTATTLSLRGVEAEWLRDRIATQCADSLLAQAITGPRLDERPVWPWDYPHRLRPDTIEILEHARAFSEVMHGAALLYNLLLARRGSQEGMGARFSDLEEDYRARLDEWADLIESRGHALEAREEARMWDIVLGANPRVTPRTRSFVSQWIARAMSDPRAVCADTGAAELVRLREIQMKRSLARLENRRQLELWNGAAGTARLGYRWPTALRLVEDVQEGLARA